MYGIENPPIIIADNCYAFSRGISTILDDIGLPTAARVNTISDCIQQLEALRNLLMAEGKPEREIAQALQLSYRTVRNHAHRILIKLNVHDRDAAVARAYRRGLL